MDSFEFTRPTALSPDRADVAAVLGVKAQFVRAGVRDDDASVAEPHGIPGIVELVDLVALQDADVEKRLNGKPPILTFTPYAAGHVLHDRDASAVTHGGGWSRSVAIAATAEHGDRAESQDEAGGQRIEDRRSPFVTTSLGGRFSRHAPPASARWG